MSKKALAVISFGTTYPKARQAISLIEESLRKTFPEYDFYRAFTSGMVIRKIKEEEGIRVPNPKELMIQLASEGYDEVLCQSLHVMPGIEYEKMLTQLDQHKDQFSKFSIGKPMLFEIEDYEQICCNLSNEIQPLPQDTAYVYMGHGSKHFANATYSQLENMFAFMGAERVFVGTVEGFPNLEYIEQCLKKQQIKKVILAPFMIVAGDHAQNDLAGDEDDSWKSILEAAGYDVSIQLKGLGEMLSVRNLFVQHAKLAQDIK